jgi:selenobiotic family peptide radical SAM maturase
MASPAQIFPRCTKILDALQPTCPVENYIDTLRELGQKGDIPAYLADLAELEESLFQTVAEVPKANASLDWRIVEGLVIHEVSWSGLVTLLEGNAEEPQKRPSLVLIFPDKDGRPRATEANSNDLLALKLASERPDLQALAREHQLSPVVFTDLLEQAADKGLLQAPRSRLTRSFASSPSSGEPQEQSSQAFTLQWHITQACDLFCRHCYDRSKREAVRLDQGLAALDQVSAFCKERGVRGQISFSGGNPLLHPDFFALYQAAADRGLRTAILGNPAPREKLERLVAIRRPEYFQTSLEGLKPHNDYIRGQGHFDQVMEFLPRLREFGIYSMVMLTLTQSNFSEVIPLGELLRERVDLFTFNRLAPVGEGAALTPCSPEEYRVFLKEYIEAANSNPILGLKDSLFNILLQEEGQSLVGGCAGFGCGAAFNFLALLPDGEVHACRKVPSKLGNIYHEKLGTIYDSELAERYRQGPSGCRSCSLVAVCRGCPAVVSGLGGKIFADIDPYCHKVGKET